MTLRKTSLHAHVFHRGGAEAPLFFLLVWNVFRHDSDIRTYTRRLCAGSTPAAGSKIPRRTLYLAFCGAFSIGATIRLEMFVGTLRRLFARIPNAHYRGRDGKLSALRGVCSIRPHVAHRHLECVGREGKKQRSGGDCGTYTAIQCRVVPVWR